MTLEIEQKFVCHDFGPVERYLAGHGVGAPTEETETDHYFNAPDRDFVQTGEVFRLRQIDDSNRFTYKGPRLPGAVKMRPELEIAVSTGTESRTQLLALLGHLGFRFVAVVKKRRRSFSLTHDGWPVTVCLDEVNIGSFVEIEILAEPEQAPEAQEVIRQLAAAMQLGQVEQRSYLKMILERQSVTPATKQPTIARTREELKQHLQEARRQRKTVGLVPTMGALHTGHRSLIEASGTNDGYVVVSIFVNPTQFGAHEDLSRYPRPFEEDVALCAAAGVDLIFHPEPTEVYPEGFATYVEVTGLQDVLEGAIRPGHFRGVATVVLKLFNLVGPDRAYFGQKDAQQARLVRKMVEDLNVPVDVVVLPTIREVDGLALSSRNRYLDPGQRPNVVALHVALTAARDAFRKGERDARVLGALMTRIIDSTPGARLDYAVVVDPDSFAALERIERSALLALAVRFGETRLIDNLPLVAEGTE
jgi:pantoate--beta-alanine ligase